MTIPVLLDAYFVIKILYCYLNRFEFNAPFTLTGQDHASPDQIRTKAGPDQYILHLHYILGPDQLLSIILLVWTIYWSGPLVKLWIWTSSPDQ
jgi:hypothetical protein